MRSLAAWMALVFVLACSGSQKDTGKKDDWDPQDLSPPPDPKPQPGDDDDDGDGEDPDPSPKPKPPSAADDYEIQHTDCDALALAYGRAWENDELKKSGDKKLTNAQIDALKRNAEEASANWQSECYKTVGTAYLRERLKCAVKAKSLERFNGCMDGTAEP
jgi:hypothetical protein